LNQWSPILGPTLGQSYAAIEIRISKKKKKKLQIKRIGEE
jgi:hypothetical protein